MQSTRNIRYWIFRIIRNTNTTSMKCDCTKPSTELTLLTLIISIDSFNKYVYQVWTEINCGGGEGQWWNISNQVANTATIFSWKTSNTPVDFPSSVFYMTECSVNYGWVSNQKPSKYGMTLLIHSQIAAVQPLYKVISYRTVCNVFYYLSRLGLKSINLSKWGPWYETNPWKYSRAHRELNNSNIINYRYFCVDYDISTANPKYTDHQCKMLDP